MLWFLDGTHVAAPGMYRIDKKNKRAVLVLMWAVVNNGKEDTLIVPVTVESVNEVFPVDDKTLATDFTGQQVTSQIPSGYATIR